MPTCTLPKIPWFRDWYNEQFRDLCERHDYCYKNQLPKRAADIDLMVGIIQRGYVWLGVLTYVAVRTIGAFNYMKAAKP